MDHKKSPGRRCTWWGALGWRFGISIALPLGAISKVGLARRDLRVLGDSVDQDDGHDRGASGSVAACCAAAQLALTFVITTLLLRRYLRVQARTRRVSCRTAGTVPTIATRNPRRRRTASRYFAISSRCEWSVASTLQETRRPALLIIDREDFADGLNARDEQTLDVNARKGRPVMFVFGTRDRAGVVDGLCDL